MHESPIALAFLTDYPTPASAAHLGEKRIAAFCSRHGYSGKKPASALLARLRSAPPGVMGPAQTAGGRDAVLALVAVLKTLGTVRKDLERSTITQLDAHPDGRIFTSLPRSGQVNAAQILAEWGDARDAAEPSVERLIVDRCDPPSPTALSRGGRS
ncbi:hypothetical protein [Nonomuraea dietziae]|uniref:hypothetical protein n=1 Tax=Nonomuraea dietziae TaxID=65515 RepID=UPI00342B0A96